FNMWLQDSAKAWNGVYVYGVNNSLGTIAQGDSVEVIGTVDEYNNLTEIKSVSYLKKINSGNTLPTPVDVTPAQAASEAYEGVLVKLNNVECTVADAGFGEFTVSDGTNTINVDDFLYKYTPTQGARYNITGVIDYSFGAFKLLPRSANDVESAQVKYTVTFTVKRSDGTTPVDGATINVTGQGNVTTDANGVATMQLPDGNYSYVIVKSGFDTKNGNFTVNGADLAVNITLIQTGIPANPIAKLSVYPNPFTDRIYFTGAEVTRVTITSVIGQVVVDRQVENTESVDVSSLDRGIYLVRFYNSKGESVLRKLVKEE
ncbi:MAG TPA: T9SS type A sorting domain-containing protein, partial [Tenuifilum sp.]|uniref:T9SS type A sorting domain-containing protein n=1 Tax=Tenuifilum sp. TaxID=2760880 RepID=UPI002CE00637|nr:T9SS type A sorting domain-containing protein [Tenuifilum sp.]